VKYTSNIVFFFTIIHYVITVCYILIKLIVDDDRMTSRRGQDNKLIGDENRY